MHVNEYVHCLQGRISWHVYQNVQQKNQSQAAGLGEVYSNCVVCMIQVQPPSTEYSEIS
jgi:hypothetical protein